MSWTARRTEQAETDLLDIWDYIGADNPAAADKLIRKLAALFERTVDFPKLGRPADEIGEGLRILTHSSYLLIYQVRPYTREVELVRVLHGARNWPALFDA